MYFYSKYGEVKMRSKDKIIAPAFDEIEIDTTEEEDKELDDNWKAHIKQGKLELEEKKIEKKDKKDLADTLRSELSTANSITDIKNILNQLII